MKEIRKRAIEISVGLLILWVLLYYSLYPSLVGFGISVFLGVVSAPICLIIADSKKVKNLWSWYVAGLFFSIVALLIALFMGKKK